MATVTINLSTIHGSQAKLSELNNYIQQSINLAGKGDTVILTGDAPIRMYLAIAYALHVEVTTLKYSSPATGEVAIFDYNPYSRRV